MKGVLCFFILDYKELLKKYGSMEEIQSGV